MRLDTTTLSLREWETPSMVDDAQREYRVAEHQEGHVVQSRIVGPSQDGDGDDDHSF